MSNVPTNAPYTLMYLGMSSQNMGWRCCHVPTRYTPKFKTFIMTLWVARFSEQRTRRPRIATTTNAQEQLRNTVPTHHTIHPTCNALLPSKLPPYGLCTKQPLGSSTNMV